MLILALLAAMAAALLRHRPWRAGIWLSIAIAIKVIPAFLLIYPAWRREWRCLGGCAIGLVVCLGLVPAAVFGPERAWQYNWDFIDKVALPGMASGEDKSRVDELFAMSTPSQSFLSVTHNTLNPPWTARPRQADPEVRAGHWLLSGLFTGLVLLAAGWKRNDSAGAAVLLLGCLSMVMILSSPVCHAHYFCLAVPLVMGILAVRWEKDALPRVEIGWALLFGLFTLAHALILFPKMETIRDLGLGLYPALVLLLAGCGALYWQRRGQARMISAETDRKRQAA